MLGVGMVQVGGSGQGLVINGNNSTILTFLKHFHTYRKITRIIQRTSIYFLPRFSKFALSIYHLSIYLSIYLSSTVFLS